MRPRSAAKRRTSSSVRRSSGGIQGTTTREQPIAATRSATAPGSARSRSIPSWDEIAAQPGLGQQAGELAWFDVGQARELDRVVAGRGDGTQGPREVEGREPADGVQLERDLVVTHGLTVRHPPCAMAPRVRTVIA